MNPQTAMANNAAAIDVDGISGPTPTYGQPDQGWGYGKNPAITMPHHRTQTSCLRLAVKTGKN